MSAERWRRARVLFEEALALPEPERLAFVERRAGGDSQLRAEVVSLLGALAGAGDFLAGTHVGVLAPGEGGAAAEPRRERIGPWRLVRVLGTGGMGVVYLGQRAAGDFEQRAAIKVVSAAVESGEILERFAAERRILAALDHPGIARLLDGGTTEDGLPYFAMEYVEGEPLLEHAAGRGLDLRSRLRLFLEVCAAVEHAHRRLVVHRDLKPGNILVDPDGRAKLLDFGIAKILASGGEGASGPATVTAQRWLTPAYASPEQVRGESTTTATDVYSLGLVLYELLTGERAHGPEARGAGEAEKVILEGQIARPSAAARRRAVAAGAAAPATERLVRGLRGDLDTILLKALAKEPGRRYGSPAELADEIERYLEGRPIRARSDTLAYRATKFAGRHRWGVALTAATAAALVAGLALALFGLRRAERAEAAARTDAATAERVTEFLVELFKISDPSEARGSAVTARELLDRGAARIEEQLAGQPAVGSRLRRAMAEAYGALGLFDPQLALLERELEQKTAAHGADSPRLADVLNLLSYGEARRGRYERARELGLRSLSLLERAGGPESISLARALITAGLGHWYLGDPVAGRALLERSLAVRDRLALPEDHELVGLLNNVAILRWQQGELDAARPLYERALELSVRLHGENHASVAHTLNNLAIVELDAGRLDRARELHERALALRRQLLAPDHLDIAESLNNLGLVERRAGDFRAARATLSEALALRERALGPDHAHVADTLGNLGDTFVGLGDLAAARAAFERALAILTAALGPDHFHLSYPLQGLAGLELVEGALAASEAHFRRALELRERALGPAHAETIRCRRALADLLRRQGRAPEALALESAEAPLRGSTNVSAARKRAPASGRTPSTVPATAARGKTVRVAVADRPSASTAVSRTSNQVSPAP